MGENSAIEWTHHTFNPWIGCTKVAAGCANCYAERDFDKRRHFAQWGQNGTRVRTSPSNWAKPLKWNRDANRDGVRRRVFCASLADVFEDWQGPIINSDGTGNAVLEDNPPRSRPMTMDDVRQDLFRLIDATPNLDWLLLTKRSENIREMWPAVGFPDAGVNGTLGRRLRLDNVWIGTSVATQEDADKNIPELLKCRDLSPVLFLSMEPLLGPVSFRWASWQEISREPGAINDQHDGLRQLDWVIVGGESGPNARPMHPDWARSIRDQCHAAGVPFHFKQWGEWLCDKIPDDFTGAHANCIDFLGRDCAISYANGERWEAHAEKSIWSKCGTYDRCWVIAHKVGKKLAGRELDGRTWDEFPAVAAGAGV